MKYQVGDTIKLDEFNNGNITAFVVTTVVDEPCEYSGRRQGYMVEGRYGTNWLGAGYVDTRVIC